MFDSKLFSVMIVLTLLAVGAAVGFQALEMKEYNLFETLQARYFPSSPESAPKPESKADVKPAEKADAKPAPKENEK